MLYNWQQGDWPNFRFDEGVIQERVLTLATHMGRVSGMLDTLPREFSEETEISLMIDEAIHSSAIEGEDLPRDEVMSSIRNRLGLNPVLDPVRDGLAKGAGNLMVSVRSSFAEPLSEKMLFEWHNFLLTSAADRVTVGSWRQSSEPMQVVSGRIDRPTVHFEAPPSATVPMEMTRFIEWFNRSAAEPSNRTSHAVTRSAIAHSYFESIHPFEDGNGRIGRVISEKALSQGIGRPVILSLSKEIESNRNTYYDALKSAQRGNEITPWISYFVDIVLNAQLAAEAQIEFVVRKSHFLQQFAEKLNDRQSKIINRMLDAGPKGFEGGMNARKYVAITKASKASATRDLQYLSSIGAIEAIGGGRSTRYELLLPVLKGR